jgi:hypothetical protein
MSDRLTISHFPRNYSADTKAHPHSGYREKTHNLPVHLVFVDKLEEMGQYPSQSYSGPDARRDGPWEWGGWGLRHLLIPWLFG